MSIKKSNKLKKNLFFGLFNQLLVFAIGLIVPRLILTSYGSEINGLLSTITQIFVYIGLLEAGIGNAALNALYKPFADKNEYDICDVFSATQKYYNKSTIIYAICVIAFSCIYPLFIQTELAYIEVMLVILLQGSSGVLTFLFVAAYKQILNADGKGYIISSITLLIHVLTSIVKIVIMSYGVNVVFLQIAHFLVNCVQVVVFVIIMKRKYPWLNKHENPNMKVLSQRKAFLVHEFSGAVFHSTDAFVLSMFCSLKVASVYSIYNMVFVALNSITNAMHNGLQYTLGQSFARNDNSYEKTHDVYEMLYMALVFSLFSVAYVLICPFVNIYTAGVYDIKYVDYLLPILFVLIQLLSCIRVTCTKLITISGNAKATQNRSIIETIINLVSSIILVNFIGIYGVLVGTILALLYRSNDIIIYANKRILKRNPFKSYSKVIVNFSIFALIILLEYLFRNKLISFCDSYISFLILGFSFTLISIVLYFGLAIVFNKEVRDLIIRKIKKV